MLQVSPLELHVELTAALIHSHVQEYIVIVGCPLNLLLLDHLVNLSIYLLECLIAILNADRDHVLFVKMHPLDR